MVDHPASFPLLLKNIPVVSDCGSESTQERRGGGILFAGDGDSLHSTSLTPLRGSPGRNSITAKWKSIRLFIG